MEVLTGIKTAPKLPGVYGIMDPHSGKIYIGSSVNVRKRLISHVHALRMGKDSAHLQRAWNKSEIPFVAFTIHLVSDRRNLLFNERLAMDALKSWDPDRGYNLDRIDSTMVRIPSLLSRKRAARSRRAAWLSLSERERREFCEKVSRGQLIRYREMSGDERKQSDASNSRRSSSMKRYWSKIPVEKRKQSFSRRKRSGDGVSRWYSERSPEVAARHRKNLSIAAKIRYAHLRARIP